VTLRVGFDAMTWNDRRGHGRVTRNLLRRLVDQAGPEEYIAVIDERVEEEAALPAGIRSCVVSASAYRLQRSVASFTHPRRALRAFDLDVFVFPSLVTWFPVRRVPTVVGIYDLIVDRFPEMHLPNRAAYAKWRLKETLAVRSARRLFTISETSRRELADRFGLDPTRLQVVLGAPDPVFYPRGAAEVEACLEPFGLRRDGYIVHSGGISPRKNIETLLDAYAALRADGGAPSLVLVGDFKGRPYADELRWRIARLGLQNAVLLPGFVGDDELACLYSGAAAFVNTSIAEGFGMPAVEAAACAAPVVLSDLPAHHETLGDVARFFRPKAVGELTDLLRTLLSDEQARRSSGEAARRSVAGLSWDRAAACLRGVIADAASANPGGAR
jgi:glycosyltransferase involved in cell wall biosynthesis